MKKTLFFAIAFFSMHIIQAQNVGIGTTDPFTSLQIAGSLSSVPVYQTATAAPTAAQTKTMVNATSITFSSTDTTGIIYDPGGPAGNYLANLTGYASIGNNGTTASYLSCVLETLDLGTGDSLIVYDGQNQTYPIMLRLGMANSGTNIPISFTGNMGYFIFKSNADASTGAGFSLTFKRKFPNSATENMAAIGRNGLFFFPSLLALRAGISDVAQIGLYSTALGLRTQAPGVAAFASGYQSVASGQYSATMGVLNTVSGYSSFAGGSGNKVAGDYAAAFGRDNSAGGDYSMVAGRNSTAGGENAIGGGHYSNATGFSSVALGGDADALGNYSAAIGGEFATASGDYSFVSGYGARSLGDYSTAFGNSTRAKSYASMAIGILNDTLTTESETVWRGTDRAFVIGDGSGATRSSSFYILKNGNTWMQGNLTQNSDARLKTNIHKVENALGKIRQLNGYTYNWKDSSMLPGIYTGVIAQEVQHVIPELVTPNSEGQLAVNYTGLIPYLIESVKALEKQNKKLQQQNVLLNKRLNAIERKNPNKKILR